MKQKTVFFSLIALCAVFLFQFTGTALASSALELDGSKLDIVWVIPFVCMLLSIALLPLIIPTIWENHFGKIAAFWGLAFLIPCAVFISPSVAVYSFLHTVLLEYIPFIMLLLALFTVSGGICLKGDLVGKPITNLLILFVGTLLAGWMGTTGAAMLLIRPLLKANDYRKYRVHSVVFFIFLVANIGGSLTPLGDPPLFLGFLKGVPFTWTLHHMIPTTLFLVVILLPLYFVIDTILYNKEKKTGHAKPVPAPTGEKLGIEGGVNFLLLGCVIASVLTSGVWRPGISFAVYGIDLELQNIFRDVAFLVITFLSLKLTATPIRERNEFNWHPIQEVAKIFFGIFLSMIPAIAILQAGTEGQLSAIINLVNTGGQPHDPSYFFLTGVLSSFLDNAPTYLVFFNTTGVPVEFLTTEMASTLVAISAGAVFMGANTYIGNAPNFMVRSIAETSGVKMPSFFGYMGWSCAILLPLFVVMSFIFF